ncbi:hypothetical protein GW17_00027194 [Ensete ventricosum]|nr:hypothetical protein GW17_00027194 [Ensete ventricosum]
MGGTYRSARLPVRGPPATGRFHQKSAISGRLRDKSTVGGRLSEKKGGRRRRGKRRKKRKEEKKDLSSVRGPRPCAVAARGSRALFLPHGEKDRGDGEEKSTEEEEKPKAAAVSRKKEEEELDAQQDQDEVLDEIFYRKTRGNRDRERGKSEVESVTGEPWRRLKGRREEESSGEEEKPRAAAVRRKRRRSSTLVVDAIGARLGASVTSDNYWRNK